MLAKVWKDYWPEFLLQIAAIAATYYVTQKVISEYTGGGADPEQEERRKTASATLRRLDEIANDDDNSDVELEGVSERRPRPRKEDIKLNRYEQMIAADVVAPTDIPVSFADIGGLDQIIDELKESVIYPLTMPELYSHSSSLLTAPSGVLLYGPPGCGKTMLAKALANEGGATFINLHISSVTEKWFGDSNKLVTAVFTLARKLQPTIIFIDEIDAVLGRRRSGEHDASGQIKAEFMTHWDGLTSASADGRPQNIMILGATNRIDDIDDAILRRLSKKFPVPRPSAAQRARIFELVLKGTKLDHDDFDARYLVEATVGMSGHDIRDVCRDAAMLPVREHLRERKPSAPIKAGDVRGIRTSDFFGGVNRTGNVNVAASGQNRGHNEAASVDE